MRSSRVFGRKEFPSDVHPLGDHGSTELLFQHPRSPMSAHAGVDLHEYLPAAQSISLVIPAYNEEARIAQTIREYASALHGLPHEILVELDGCKDATADLVRKARSEYPAVRMVEFSERLGKGGGLLEAMRRANGDWVGYVDADGSTPPEEFMKVAALGLSDGWDAVIGSRYWNRPHMIRELGYMRWGASRGFNLLVRHLFELPYRDTQCGTKVFRRRALKAVVDDMTLTDYAFDVELLWRLDQQGFRVCELPILWNHRDGSTIRLPSVVSRMFLDVLRLRVNP